MKVLVIGGGGREHAIAQKLAKSKQVSIVYCAPGNGGTATQKKCKNVNLNTIKELLDFAKNESIDLTVVGPEEKLTLGIVDKFMENGLKIVGPSKEAAKLEGSKIYAKEFMEKYGVRTAGFKVFDDYEKAKEYFNSSSYPIVIKADGLAAGKGVAICQNKEEALDTIKEFMLEDVFKGSGKNIVVEEFIEGVEASILALTDGKTIKPFISAKDHKCIFDNDKGPNTGGMGAIAPNPYFKKSFKKDFEDNILKPTLKGIMEEGFHYCGVVFFGVMMTKKGCYLLEYNVRLGDPETQAVLPLMKNDFYDLLMKTVDKELKDVEISWKKRHSCAVIAASEGYPLTYKTGFDIDIKENVNGKVYISGADLNGDKLKTSGGRVLAIENTGKTLKAAREKCYEDMQNIDFKGIYYRKDIGLCK